MHSKRLLLSSQHVPPFRQILGGQKVDLRSGSIVELGVGGGGSLPVSVEGLSLGLPGMTSCVVLGKFVIGAGGIAVVFTVRVVTVVVTGHPNSRCESLSSTFPELKGGKWQRVSSVLLK